MREVTTIACAQELAPPVAFANSTITTVAYADDLCVFANDRSELSRRIVALRSAMQQAGLSLNTRKSRIVSTVRRGKTKQIFVNSVPLTVGAETVVATGPAEVFRYLGVDFGWSGPPPVNHRMIVARLLDDIQRAPLKPHQRLHVIRVAVLARFIHQMVLGRVHGSTLVAIDRLLRRAVRKNLRLPQDTPMGFFHGRIRDGGLGIPSACTIIPLAKKRRVERLMASPDQLLRSVGEETVNARGQGLLRRPICVGDAVVSSTSEAATAWKEQLYRCRDGAGLRGVTSVATKWIADPPPNIFPAFFIKGTQLRAGVLPTGARLARGGRGAVPMCRGPCARPESLNHILQGCSLTHGPRVKRHDNVVKFVARKIRQKTSLTVIREAVIPFSDSFFKPDLIVVSGETATVVDVAITSDGYIRTATTEKARKYGSDAAVTAIRNFLSAEFTIKHVTQLPLVFTWRGLVAPSAPGDFRRLGLTVRDFVDLVWLVVRGSLTTYNQYFRSTFLA